MSTLLCIGPRIWERHPPSILRNNWRRGRRNAFARTGSLEGRSALSGTAPQVPEESKASNLKAAGTIFIAVVGAGVLGLPYAFAQAGLVTGIAFLTLVAALALYCMLLLAQCKRWEVRG